MRRALGGLGAAALAALAALVVPVLGASPAWAADQSTGREITRYDLSLLTSAAIGGLRGCDLR